LGHCLDAYPALRLSRLVPGRCCRVADKVLRIMRE
jgi:hypothetical protein